MDEINEQEQGVVIETDEDVTEEDGSPEQSETPTSPEDLSTDSGVF